MKTKALAIMLLFLAIALWFAIINQGGMQRLREVDTAESITIGGSANAGFKVITGKSCGACHDIPGIRGPHGNIGPSLSDFKNRATIAGVISNSSEHLIRWLQHPREVDPQTAMPDLNLTEQEARDAAAYLYSLQK